MTILSDSAAASVRLLTSDSERPRRIRLFVYAAALAGFAGLDAYGFWAHPNLLANAWTPGGHTRFLAFAASYFATVAALIYFVPQRLPLILALTMAIVPALAVGVGAPAAVAIFMLSSLVLGRALLWWRTGDGHIPFEDMILATLFGAAIYMTAIGWTAMFPVHFAAVHMIALALPFVIWPRTLAQCLRSLAVPFKPAAWRSRSGLLGLALAAFIPLVHLIGAVVLPQANSDATVVHLAVPTIVGIKHYWPFDVERFVFGVFPIGMSWMILPSYLLGGEFAARLLNLCFFLATALLLFSVVHRYVTVGVAWLLVALYASTPFFLTENGNIFVENLWVALLFAATFALWRFKETGQERYFLLAISLAAVSLSVKLLGLFLVAVLLLLMLREFLQRPSRLIWALGLFVVMAAYPYAYAFIKTGNPVFPLLNQIFKSPYFAEVAFVGLNRPVPTNLYELTFQTQRWMDNGGTHGSLGFQYLVLIPLGLLALGRRFPYIGWVSLACAIIYLASLFRFAEANVRYFYPALPFIAVVAAIGYAQARELSRSLYFALCFFAAAMTAVNAYAGPVSAWAHRDFSFALAFSRIGIDDYLSWVAPERKLISYLNLEYGSAVRVVNFARPMVIGFQGDMILGNWYNYLFVTKRLKQAASAEDVHRLMREERITRFMAFKPGSGNPNFSPAVEAFLAKYTETEFASGDVRVLRYREAWRFTEELIKNGDFSDGLTGWAHTPANVQDTATRAVPVNGVSYIVQRVAIDDRMSYRYAMTARCAAPGTHLRHWINWYDNRQRLLSTTMIVRECDGDVGTYVEGVSPPEGARLAELIVAGMEADRSVAVSNVSLRW